MFKLATIGCGFVLVLFPACSDQVTTPSDPSEATPRRLQPAIFGETGVNVKINGQNLTDKALARRLRVEVVADTPTFEGKANNKIIKVGVLPTQADSVGHCTGFCEVNVIFHDGFGSVPSPLDSTSGVLADGDYTVKLFRDGSTLVGSKAIAINHPDRGGSNGTFLDETGRDQIVTFYLNQLLVQISQPTVDFPHTRASTHLSANIIQPSGSDTTVVAGQSLTVKGSAQHGVGGTKKYAWDWNASGGNQETFDTEFTTSTTDTHTYNTPGNYKIRLVVRDGEDGILAPPYGGHYAVSTTKTVHVIGDNAAAAGNSLAAGTEVMCLSEVRLVYYAMKNTGTTTWSPSNYKLSLHHDSGWYPTSVSLSSSVAPNQTRTFNFNLYAPSYPGYYAAAYQMKKSAFFGEQNIGYAYVSDFSCGGAAPDFSPSSGLEEDPKNWDTSGKKRDVLPLRLYISPLDPKSAYLNYGYSTSEAKEADLILRIEYDSTRLDPDAVQLSMKIENLKVVTGASMTGEYWIRVRGQLPEGGGPLVRLPFRVLRDSPDQQWGTLTVFY